MKKPLILCPVDYSGSTEPALEIAENLARTDNSKIVLLHVIEPNQKGISAADSQTRQFHDRLQDHFLVKYGIEFEHLTRHGDPADVIVELAKQRAADLIVMGTHGRTGLGSLLVGSVAQSVMT